jgi:hypothetical protein
MHTPAGPPVSLSAEFDFRYSNRIALGAGDTKRTEKALTGIVGKRLTYRGTGRAANA